MSLSEDMGFDLTMRLQGTTLFVKLRVTYPGHIYPTEVASDWLDLTPALEAMLAARPLPTPQDPTNDH